MLEEKPNGSSADSFEGLLASEHNNAAATIKVLRQIEPKLVDQIDAIARFITSVANVFGESGEYDKYNKLYNEGLQGLGSDRSLAAMLQTATIIGKAEENNPLEKTKEGRFKAESFLVRLWLLMRFSRDFQWCVTDLLRLRLTPAKGYLRIQVETIAIMISATDSTFAHQWLTAIAPDKGKKFFNDHHHKTIMPVVKAHNLNDLYELGSNAALHSRAAGVLHGLALARKDAPAGHTGIMYQEMNHAIFIAGMLNFFIQSHIRLIYALRSAFPELNWSELDKQLDALKVVASSVNAKVAGLYREHRTDIWKSEVNLDPILEQ
jgi:hypothetical protein